MRPFISSKNIDGITDLVVVAPIKQGFIEAYENITYATRLRIVSEALNRVRVTAREHEMITPFSDVTRRILTLLDFRVGVLDKDVFDLPTPREARENEARGDKDGKTGLRSRRFLYLTATFDGAWEPYMRLIWDPLGPFLDLLFCNCEGYVTAAEHSFDEYAQWVRDNQMDSAIFYSTTGLTVRDHLYLNRLEQWQRSRKPEKNDPEIARLTMPKPDEAAKAERDKALCELAQKNLEPYLKILEMALEALTVLYRLADYHPPEWLAKQPRLKEGHYLVRAAESLLLEWDELIPHAPAEIWKSVEKAYADPLLWYRTGRKHLRKLDAERERKRPKDPRFRPSEIQGGMLKPQGHRTAPMRQGALLLMTIADAALARRFLGKLEDAEAIHFVDGPGSEPGEFFRNIALTPDGLRRLGLDTNVVDWFPQEFREGMEMRSGLIGDMRENHPRRWTLPARNWPPPPAGADPFAKARPPIEMSEIDIVLQIRTAGTNRPRLLREIKRLADMAAPGVMLQGYELMRSDYDSKGFLLDHFGFSDGISQPKPTPGLVGNAHEREKVRLGELLLGYRNDRDDFAPTDFTPVDPEHPTGYEKWRIARRRVSLGYQLNGSFLVIRKLQQEVERFEQFIKDETKRINKDHPHLKPPMTEDRLKARMLGRWPDGKPLITPSCGLNGFTYKQDPTGDQCPLAAHIRRVNPREPFLKRNAPRLVRRGMSFGYREGFTGQEARGMMFMAYNASIAEQYETIQRWINGGNSTFIASGHNDPILGVAPETGELVKVQRVFRFVEEDEVIRVPMPDAFVGLSWGLYLFVPSRTALRKLRRLRTRYRPIRELLETRGRAVIERLERIGDDAEEGREWKRLIEDFDVKDPSERDITPDLWSAIRWYKGGSVKIEGGVPIVIDWNKEPPTDQPVVLSASYTHVMRVLSDWRRFTTEEQLRRIEPSGIPIYVTQQPDDKYKAKALQNRFRYRRESKATNKILMAYGENVAFADGYRAGKAILEKFREGASKGGRDYYKLELRRQFLLPALQVLCKIWYGMPDEDTLPGGAWTWQPPDERDPPGARCPGDFLSPSRHAFYPRPGEAVETFAGQHGKAVHEASEAFVYKHRNAPDDSGLGTVSKRMFKKVQDDKVLARNLVGTMIGAIPPMDGNLRGILLEWLVERTLWRHQAALRRALGDRPAIADFHKAREVLYGPVSQAMCKRPSPDLLYRTALDSTVLHAGDGFRYRRYDKELDVEIGERDLVVVSLVSATQQSLTQPSTPNGNVSIVFGGKRRKAYQPGTRDIHYPVHACPAQKMAMGAIMGILAALLDAGRIQALPASLIVKISWPGAAPPLGR